MVVELSLHGFAGFRRLVPLVLVSQRLEVGWSCGTSPSFPRSGDGSSDAGWADQSPTRRSPASNQCGVTVARSVLFLTTNILRAQMGMEGQGTGPDRAAARHLEQGGAGQPRRFASVFVVFRGDTSRCMKRRLQGHLVVEGDLLARSTAQLASLLAFVSSMPVETKQVRRRFLVAERDAILIRSRGAQVQAASRALKESRLGAGT